VVEIVHGTTVASNTILQKTGAVTGLVTTRGFRDVLELRRSARADLYDLFQDAPAILIPRRRRHEISERIGADGYGSNAPSGTDLAKKFVGAA